MIGTNESLVVMRDKSEVGRYRIDWRRENGAWENGLVHRETKDSALSRLNHARLMGKGEYVLKQEIGGVWVEVIG